MRKIFLIYALILTSEVLAQDLHPIDQLTYQARQQAVTTAGMMAAEEFALKGWEQLLDVVLQSLQEQTQKSTGASLAKSQAAWEQYRDAEFKTIERIYYAELNGTMWRPVAVSARARVIRDRTLTLVDRYRTLVAQQDSEDFDIQGFWKPLSSGYHPSLEIYDELTLIWQGLEKQDRKVAFYQIASQCSSQSTGKDQKVLIVQPLGSTDGSKCYFIKLIDHDRLHLTEAGGKRLWTFYRDQ